MERQDAREILRVYINKRTLGKPIDKTVVDGYPLNSRTITDAFFLLAQQGSKNDVAKYIWKALRAGVAEHLRQASDLSSRLLALAQSEKYAAHKALMLISEQIGATAIAFSRWKSIVRTLSQSESATAHEALMSVFKGAGSDRRLGFVERDEENNVEALYLYGHSVYGNSRAKLAAVVYQGSEFFGGSKLLDKVETYCRNHRLSKQERADSGHPFQESVRRLGTDRGLAGVFGSNVIPGHRRHTPNKPVCDKFAIRTQDPGSPVSAATPHR